MTTFWDKVQVAASAAIRAWRTVPGLDNPTAASDNIYALLSSTDQQRIDLYNAYWKYYRGQHKKHLKVRMTPVGPGPDDNVTINVSRRVVNKGATFLFGEPLKWELTEGDQTPEEEMLERIWHSSEWRMSFLSEVAINGGVTGDAYIQIRSRGEQELPSLVNLNPSIVFPHWNPQDIDEVWAYELRYRRQGKIARTVHALVDNGEYWEIFTEVLQGNNLWKRLSDEDRVWPWPFSSIVHVKNYPNPNSYFGLSDLEDADLNDAINQATSNMNRIIRIFAHPIVWGKMMGQIDLDPSTIMMSQNKDASLDSLELAKDLASAQTFLRYLRTMWAEITQVPENDPDRLAIGAQSGFALKVLYSDLIQKTNIKRSLYGQGIVELNRRLLSMLNMGDENICKLYWETPLPEDKRATTQSDQFDLEAGLVSKKTLAARRGYDWEVEQIRLGEQQAGQLNVGEMLLSAFDRGQVE